MDIEGIKKACETLDIEPPNLDIETTGINTGEGGIWQIGAFELENPESYFLQEGRIDDEDKIMEEALKITEKTEEELRDKNKQSQKQLILNFLF